jgi:hypothetical protein
MIEDQLETLRAQRAEEHAPPPVCTCLPNGGYLITVPDVDIGSGWTQRTVNVLFVAPPGYPAAQPDCFWVEPVGLRLAGGNTPQNSNDANPIPGDVVNGRRTTWFSWHLQSWDPNRDSLLTFFNVIMKRLKPAR